MPRVLIVAWLFAPHANVGSRRPMRLAKWLPSLGWDVTVLTQASVPERFREARASDDELDARVRVLRVYDPPLLAKAVAALDARASKSQSKSSNNVSASSSSLSFAERWIPTEPAIVWAPHAALRAIAERERYDAVLSTSYPFSAHLVGRAIARARRIPWIADLRDPWTLHFSHARKQAVARAIERTLEAQTIAEASAVTVTTESLRDAYQQRFQRQSAKIHAIRNSFDALALPAPARATSPARLVHFGHVYGGARTLGPVLDALAAVSARRGWTEADAVLENYGRFSSEDMERARALGVERLVRVREPVPYEAGMRSLTTASLLLLPTWESEFGPLFLPAKLFDYLPIGAPVLAIGRNEELARILDETKTGVLIEPSRASAIEGQIERAVDGALAVDAVAERVNTYSSRAMAERFSRVLDAVCARGKIARS